MKAVSISRKPSVFYVFIAAFLWLIPWLLASKHYFPGMLAGILGAVGVLGMMPIMMLTQAFIYRYFSSVILEKNTLLLFGHRGNIANIPLSHVSGVTERYVLLIRIVTIEFSADGTAGRINILPEKHIFRTGSGKSLLEVLRELSDKLEAPSQDT